MIVALLLYFFIFAGTISATSSVVVVNQVRGTECCEIGSLDNLRTQLATTAKLEIPTTYSLRYDALQNKEIVELLRSEQKKYPDLMG